MSLKVRANEISNWTNVDKDVLTGDNGPSSTFDMMISPSFGTVPS
jgi:hypothetical protein